MSDETVDPAIKIRESCSNFDCAQFNDALKECTKRVNSTPGGHENCEEELFDLLKCVDACAAPKLFVQLK